MAVFKISISEAGIFLPAVKFESPTIEDALETVWQTTAATMERAEATVLGVGIAYRYARRGGQWQQLASHPVPGFEP